MFTIVPSSTTMSCATEMRTSAQPRCLPTPVSGASLSGATRVSVMCCVTFWWRDVSRGRGGGRQDDLVDDAGDDVPRGDLADEDEAVHDDPGQGRGEQVDVDVRADLA